MGKSFHSYAAKIDAHDHSPTDIKTQCSLTIFSKSRNKTIKQPYFTDLVKQDTKHNYLFFAFLIFEKVVYSHGIKIFNI